MDAIDPATEREPYTLWDQMYQAIRDNRDGPLMIRLREQIEAEARQQGRAQAQAAGRYANATLVAADVALRAALRSVTSRRDCGHGHIDVMHVASSHFDGPACATCSDAEYADEWERVDPCVICAVLR